MFGKIEINGTIEVVTGMHIGGSSEFAAIGAIDSPVVRDSLTRQPIIPGSSLKGKLRTLLVKNLAKGGRLPKDPNGDPVEILRLFGSSEKNKIKMSRLQFTDMIISNKKELLSRGANSITEVKFENSIDRLTAVANPRQIERVIRGAEFPMSIIYNVENETEIEDDFRMLGEGLKMLEYDYLGGHGSRGSGRVKITGLTAKQVTGDVDSSTIDKCNDILKEV